MCSQRAMRFKILYIDRMDRRSRWSHTYSTSRVPGMYILHTVLPTVHSAHISWLRRRGQVFFPHVRGHKTRDTKLSILGYSWSLIWCWRSKGSLPSTRCCAWYLSSWLGLCIITFKRFSSCRKGNDNKCSMKVYEDKRRAERVVSPLFHQIPFLK